MQCLCASCHYIGEPNKKSEPTYIGIILTAILGLIFLLLAFWHSIFLIGTFLSVSYSLLFLSECFAYNDLCPNCKEKSLIPVNSDNAKKIINDKNLSIESIPKSPLDILSNYESVKYETRVICTKCHRIGAGINEGLCHLRMGVIVLTIGLLSIPLAYLTLFSLIGSFIYLLFGITFVLSCFIGDHVCGTCKTETMIPLDSHKAKFIANQVGLDIAQEHMVSNPPLFNYRYGLYVLFIAWIALGYSMYKLYIYFSSL